MINEARLGRVQVSRKVIEDETRKVLEVFKFLDLLPVSIAQNFYPDVFEYLCFSPKFPILIEGALVPLYQIEVMMDAALFTFTAKLQEVK